MAETAKAQADWKEVYRGLCHEIDAGHRSPGSDLPTIAALSEQTGLNAYGARRVMERLRQEGRAQSWQGKGFRVAMPIIRLKMSDKSPVFGDNVRALGLTSHSSLVAARTVGAPEAVARRMRQRVGTRVRLTETVRQVNGHTVALSIDYFVRNRLDDIAATLASTGSVSRSLARHGISGYKRDFTELICRFPTAHEALTLSIPRSQPVYATMGANLDDQGDVFQVSLAVLRADCVAYEI